ncbi:MAG: hypothetical protein ACOX6V_03120 [Patescibacteria group bacterium]|jgi:hypothetical protein
MKNKAKFQLSKNWKSSFPQQHKFGKQFGMQGKVAAMHNTQRASGRRGN